MSITGMDFISFETSQNMLELLEVNDHRYERVPLSDALGRVLAEDIVANIMTHSFQQLLWMAMLCVMKIWSLAF